MFGTIKKLIIKLQKVIKNKILSKVTEIKIFVFTSLITGLVFRILNLLGLLSITRVNIVCIVLLTTALLCYFHKNNIFNVGHRLSLKRLDDFILLLSLITITISLFYFFYALINEIPNFINYIKQNLTFINNFNSIELLSITPENVVPTETENIEKTPEKIDDLNKKETWLSQNKTILSMFYYTLGIGSIALMVAGFPIAGTGLFFAGLVTVMTFDPDAKVTIEVGVSLDMKESSTTNLEQQKTGPDIQIHTDSEMRKPSAEVIDSANKPNETVADNTVALETNSVVTTPALETVSTITASETKNITNVSTDINDNNQNVDGPTELLINKTLSRFDAYDDALDETEDIVNTLGDLGHKMDFSNRNEIARYERINKAWLMLMDNRINYGNTITEESLKKLSIEELKNLNLDLEKEIAINKKVQKAASLFIERINRT